MAEVTKKSKEFRRYRQFLAGLYLSVAIAGFSLLAASVAHELLFRSPTVELPPRSVELGPCHELVSRLYEDLGEVSLTLLGASIRGELEESDVPEHWRPVWREFSNAWRNRWDVAEARCGFSDLAGKDMGVAYDDMARIHGELPALRLRYQSLLVRFEKEQAVELARMRQVLDESRAAIAGRAMDVPSHPRD